MLKLVNLKVVKSNGLINGSNVFIQETDKPATVRLRSGLTTTEARLVDLKLTRKPKVVSKEQGFIAGFFRWFLFGLLSFLVRRKKTKKKGLAVLLLEKDANDYMLGVKCSKLEYETLKEIGGFNGE